MRISVGTIVEWMSLACIAIAVFATGCDSARINQGDVAGSVRLDEKPIEDGAILFRPIGDTKGRVAGGQIKEGRYKLFGNAAAAVGWNRVEIRALRKTGKMIPKPFGKSGEQIEELVEGVAPRFHAASTLKVEVKQGKNIFDFDVASQ